MLVPEVLAVKEKVGSSGLTDVSVSQPQCVTECAAESFFPSNSTDHHEIPALRGVEKYSYCII